MWQQGSSLAAATCPSGEFGSVELLKEFEPLMCGDKAPLGWREALVWVGARSEGSWKAVCVAAEIIIGGRDPLVLADDLALRQRPTCEEPELHLRHPLLAARVLRRRSHRLHHDESLTCMRDKQAGCSGVWRVCGYGPVATCVGGMLLAQWCLLNCLKTNR